MIELPHILKMLRSLLSSYETAPSLSERQRAYRHGITAMIELEKYESLTKDALGYVREVTTSGPIVRLRLVAREDNTDSCEGCYYYGIRDLCNMTHAKTAWPQCTKHIWEISND